MANKVGTAEILPDEESKIRKVRTGGGFGGGNGNKNNGRRGGGGGGDRNDHDKQPEHEQFVPLKYYLAMWIVLSMVVMTFAGLIGTYIFLAVNRSQEWQPFDLPIQVFISTFIILASSVTFEFARHSITGGNQKNFWIWLMATTGLGAAFISSQLFVWLELWRKGIYVAGNPYAGFFYILTVAHALHIVGGIIALGYLILRAAKPTQNKENLFRRQTAAGVVGLFWHSMDGLWLVLLALLAFLK